MGEGPWQGPSVWSTAYGSSQADSSHARALLLGAQQRVRIAVREDLAEAGASGGPARAKLAHPYAVADSVTFEIPVRTVSSYREVALGNGGPAPSARLSDSAALVARHRLMTALAHRALPCGWMQPAPGAGWTPVVAR